MRRTILALCTAAAVCAPASVAAASTVVEDPSPDVRTGCLGTRHSPAAGYPDSFSTLLVALVLRDTIEALTVALTSTDGSGATTTAEVPIEDGVVETELPLVAYGPGTLTAEADGEPLDLGSLSTYEIGDPEPPCSSTLFPAGFEPEPEPIPAPEPLREPGEPEATSPTEVAIAPEPTGVADGPGLLPWVLIGLGAVGAGVGGTRTRRRRGAGTGTRDGEDEEDDEDPRDAPPPVLYGEEIDTETVYAWAVKLVTGGDFGDLSNPGNSTVPIRFVPEGYTVVGTYYVAFTTEVFEHVETDQDTEFQVRGLTSLGVPEAAMTTDPVADLWNDVWTHLEVDRSSYAGDIGDAAMAEATTRLQPKGWRSDSPWISGEDGQTKFDKVAAPKLAKGATTIPSTTTSVQRQITRMSVQFEPHVDGAAFQKHLFKGHGQSTMQLRTESRCAYCADSNAVQRSICNPNFHSEVSGGFDVEAEALHGATGFHYTNETNQTKLNQLGKGGGGTPFTFSAPKAGIPLGKSGVTISEVSITIVPSEGHNEKKTAPQIRNADSFDHAQTLRMTMRAATSVTAVSTIGVTPDNVAAGLIWATKASSRAHVDHDLRLHGRASRAFQETFGFEPAVEVMLDGDDAVDGTITVEGLPVAKVRSPRRATPGYHWWSLTGGAHDQ